MIRSIVFDWGGVLIEEPSLKIFTYCANTLGVSVQKFLQIYGKYNHAFQKGTMDEQIFWENICSELQINKPTISSLGGIAFRQSYEEKKENLMLAFTLKKKGYRFGLLPNTEVPAMTFFQEQKYSMFDVAIFSCAEGTRKPEECIYQILL
jgi:FMN phosphatase YigB (HAD superfamily)